VGRQPDERDVRRDGEGASAVPAGAVEDQRRVRAPGQAGGELGQERPMVAVVASGRTRATPAPVAGSTAAKM
jgi:hypothetical protein